jgi:hypothetical protein
MTAIAPRIAYAATERPRITVPVQHRIVEAPASPWRAPLFYLSFLAGLVLLVAVAMLLIWRMVTRVRLG